MSGTMSSRKMFYTPFYAFIRAHSGEARGFAVVGGCSGGLWTEPPAGSRGRAPGQGAKPP